MGVALLVSSAGLAASLLAGVAFGEAEAQNISWQPSGRASQPASELAASQPAAESVLPPSLSRLTPAYAFASSSTISILPVSTTPGFLPEPSASAAPPPPAAASTPLSAVQQSWRTFKQAFR